MPGTDIVDYKLARNDKYQIQLIHNFFKKNQTIFWYFCCDIHVPQVLQEKYVSNGNNKYSCSTDRSPTSDYQPMPVVPHALKNQWITSTYTLIHGFETLSYLITTIIKLN